MNSKKVLLGITCCLLSSISISAASNESVVPFLVYSEGTQKFSARSIAIVAKYDLLVMSRGLYPRVNGDTWSAIKAVSPDTKIFLYQVGPYVADNNDNLEVGSLNNLGRYNNSRGSSQGSINQDHPGWFLKNNGGQRVQNIRNSHVLALDYGNKDVAAYWAKHTLEDIAFQNWRADGVYIDEVAMCSNSSLKNNSRYIPLKYSNCQSWNRSMTDFLMNVSRELQANNQLVMGNIGSSFDEHGFDAWKALGQHSSSPNIMLEEGAFVTAWGPGVALHWPVKNWQRQIDLPSSVNRHVAMISHTDLAPGHKGVSSAGEAVSHTQIMRFAIGSYLLARNASGPATYFLFDDDRRRRGSTYDRLISIEIYDEFDIGAPTEKYEKKLPDQDLYFRKYTKGYVYVNPSSDKILSVKAESDAEFSTNYSNARKEGSEWYFDLPPHDAAIIKMKVTTSINKQLAPPNPPKLYQ